TRTNESNVPRMLATVVGVTFLLVGVLGFVPGITTGYDSLKFAGHEGHAQLLGLFEISILHNIVHLLYGVAGLAMARKASSAVAYLIGGGVIYLVLLVYGLVIDKEQRRQLRAPQHRGQLATPGPGTGHDRPGHDWPQGDGLDHHIEGMTF
ncbi:MAG: DUF4383 domain-containing protein, partial [Nocardioidaceae bacterium]